MHTIVMRTCQSIVSPHSVSRDGGLRKTTLSGMKEGATILTFMNSVHMPSDAELRQTLPAIARQQKETVPQLA